MEIEVFGQEKGYTCYISDIRQAKDRQNTVVIVIVIVNVIVNSIFLKRPQKRGRGNQLIHRRLVED